jgi:hypothetical protein
MDSSLINFALATLALAKEHVKVPAFYKDWRGMDDACLAERVWGELEGRVITAVKTYQR